jgi:multidrug efflux system membrane fusion protein
MKNLSTSHKAAAVFALSALAALVLSACDEPSAKEAGQASAGGPPITVAAVLEKSVVESQEFTGRLEAVEHVEIRPRVSGFISEVHFTPGAEVKKGELLFVIDPRPYQAEANRAEGAALAARAKADLARTELTRADKLLAEKAISQHDADEKAASYKELEAAARAAHAAYESAALNLSFTRVQSPINGRVSKAEVTLGNLVDGNVVLTSVVSSNPMYVSFDGDEDSYLRASALRRAGKQASVKVGLANETGYTHEGKLDFLDNRVDPATGSVRMRARLDNADGVLAPGLFARVQLTAASSSDRPAMLIADRAVATDQSHKYVFVVGKDSKAEYRLVTLGPVIDGLRVVRSGLQPGEKVIVNGLQRVKPGAAVTAQTVPMDVSLNAPAKGEAQIAKAAGVKAGAEGKTEDKAGAGASH